MVNLAIAATNQSAILKEWRAIALTSKASPT